MPEGGLPSLHYNEIRDLTATLLTEVCSQVCTEPELQPVHNPDELHLSTSNTQKGAHLDIAMNGLWGSCSVRCFTDVRIFNPLAPSNSSSSLSSTLKKHENTKRRAYGQRIRGVEHAYTVATLNLTQALHLETVQLVILKFLLEKLHVYVVTNYIKVQYQLVLSNILMNQLCMHQKIPWPLVILLNLKRT